MLSTHDNDQCNQPHTHNTHTTTINATNHTQHNPFSSLRPHPAPHHPSFCCLPKSCTHVHTNTTRMVPDPDKWGEGIWLAELPGFAPSSISAYASFETGPEPTKSCFSPCQQFQVTLLASACCSPIFFLRNAYAPLLRAR